MEDLEKIRSVVVSSIEVKKRLLENEALLETIIKVKDEIVRSYRSGKGKVLFCGNGGSAADAQHLAAELTGRYYKDREPLNAEALHVNSSYITAVANDYSYEEVYARLIKAQGNKGDILIALSTSGNSPNIVKAIESARSLGMLTIGMTGETGGQIKDLCDYLINVPSQDTPRIQESHIMIGHMLCEMIENELF